MSSHDRQHRASTDAPAARARRPIQARLEVGPVDDPMEVEAEATADRVIAAIQTSGGAAAVAARSAAEEEEPLQGSRIARAAAEEEEPLQGSRIARAATEEEEPLQGSRIARAAAEEEEPLQGSRIARASVIGAEGGSVDPELEARLTAGGGSPLPEPVRATMEGAFGADFSAVRVSENPAAADIGARAYTTGSDIRFAPGQYKPESTEGQHLLAHELTHVVQQGAAAARSVVRRHAVGDANLKPEDIATLNSILCFDSVAYVLKKAKRIDASVAGKSLQQTDGTKAETAGAIPEGAVINFVSRGFAAKSWDDPFSVSRHTMLAAGGGAAWASNNGALGGPNNFTLSSLSDMVVWEQGDDGLRAWPANTDARVPSSELEVRWFMP